MPGDGRLPLPTSSPTLLVQQFELEPPPLAEHFHGAQRWFTYEPGTHVALRGRFRTYADGDAAPASAARVLAGAARVHSLDAR